MWNVLRGNGFKISKSSYLIFFYSGFTILWIGLTDVVNQNKYVYPSSGRKPIYTNWDRGKLEIGKKKKEDCAALQTFGKRK